MNKPRIIVFLIVCRLACASAVSAAGLDDILGNLGCIDIHGLPRLSLEIADQYDVGELAALGFEFKLRLTTVLRQGRTAGTEWSLPGLQTYARIDAQGDVIWLTTSGQTVRFRKKGSGYAGGKNGETVKVTPESNTIEITTPASVKWRYRNGFLESIDYRKNTYPVTTDRGTILSISKKILNREIPLLKCAYSARNGLEELEFYGGRKCRLLWSAEHNLTAVDDPKGRRFDFEYDDSLLTCWTKANGPRNELKWLHLDYVRETAFQTPPVLLREDASHVYSWDKGRGVDIVKVYDKTGTFVSKTTIGAAGVRQTTPKEKIAYMFE